VVGAANDRDNLRYTRSDNKFLWVENWQRSQELLDEQQQTDWVKELNALQRQVHPSHPDLRTVELRT
jgi:gamma-glutamyl:cysteine ligase YbdK (ATP-grasp superfamily)